MIFGNWNVQSVNNKLNEVLRELERYKIDIAVLSETKKKGKGTEEKEKFLHFYSGVPKDARAKSGVSIVIRKSLKKCIKSWEQVNDRIIHMNLEIKGHEIVVVGVYAPNEDAISTVKEEFYKDVTKVLDQISNRKQVLMLGDFNGRIGQRRFDAVVGPYGEATLNDNGERLIELCYQHSLRIQNSWFAHKDIHRFTWVQPTMQRKSIIDYAITKQNTRFKIMDVSVRRGAECGSDHYLLETKIYLPYIQYKRNSIDENAIENVSTIDGRRYKLESLRHDSTQFLYKIRLAQKLDIIDMQEPAEKVYEVLKTCIKQAAEEALGYKDRTAASGDAHIWWNSEIDKKVKEKKQRYGKWLASGSPEDRRRYNCANRETKQMVNKAKNAAWENACAEINMCRGNTRANHAWKFLKSIRADNKEKGGISIIGISKWRQYYEELLTEDRDEYRNQETIDAYEYRWQRA